MFSLRSLACRRSSWASCRATRGASAQVLPAAAGVFARNEMEPLQTRFRELNDWLGLKRSREVPAPTWSPGGRQRDQHQRQVAGAPRKAPLQRDASSWPEQFVFFLLPISPPDHQKHGARPPT